MTWPWTARDRARSQARLWSRPGWAAAAVLVALLPGLALWAWATARWGLGANSDGLTYLVLARHWYRAGVYARLTPAGWKPMTHFPPGYPQAIAAFMPFTRGDAAEAARILAGLTLLAYGALAARAVFRYTRHVLPTAAVALWLAVAFPMQRVVTQVLSEPLFLVQIGLLAWALDRWQAAPTRRRAVLTGLLAAWAVYTRWIGLALLVWAAGDMLWAWRRARPPDWMRQAGAALLAAGLPIAALLAAGAAVAPAATGRPLGWHPPDAAKWSQAATTIAQWVTPLFGLRTPSQAWAWAAVVLVGTLTIALWAARGPRAEPVPHPATPDDAAFVWRWGSLLVGYGGLLVLAITVADASTPLDWRLLAPMFWAGSVLTVGAAWRTLGRRWPTALLLAWVGLTLLRYTWTWDRQLLVRKMHQAGAGLRNETWQTAAIWPVLRDLPSQVVVVTNELPETEYYTDRPAWPLPAQPVWRAGRPYVYDPVAGAYIPVAQDEPTAWGAWVAKRWQGRCAAIVLVTVALPDDEAAAVQAQLAAHLTLVQQVDGGVLFAPPRPACPWWEVQRP